MESPGYGGRFATWAENRLAAQHTYSLSKRSRDRCPEKAYKDGFKYKEIVAIPDIFPGSLVYVRVLRDRGFAPISAHKHSLSLDKNRGVLVNLQGAMVVETCLASTSGTWSTIKYVSDQSFPESQSSIDRPWPIVRVSSTPRAFHTLGFPSFVSCLRLEGTLGILAPLR